MPKYRVFLMLLIIVILALLLMAQDCDNDNGGPEGGTATPAPPLVDASEGQSQLFHSAKVAGHAHP